MSNSQPPTLTKRDIMPLNQMVPLDQMVLLMIEPLLRKNKMKRPKRNNKKKKKKKRCRLMNPFQ